MEAQVFGNPFRKLSRGKRQVLFLWIFWGGGGGLAEWVKNGDVGIANPVGNHGNIYAITCYAATDIKKCEKSIYCILIQIIF
jgi:hypothetical protein